MVDILSMVDLTSISAILAAIGVFVGVIFAILQLRDLVKTRQTDLVIRLYSTFGSNNFQKEMTRILNGDYKNYSDFMKKEGLLVHETGLFFEGVGLLLHRKLIDISLVCDLFGVSVKMFWERSKPLIKDARKLFNAPRFGEWTENLYNEMQKREQQLTAIQ